MDYWNGNSFGNGPGGPPSAETSPPIVPVDTTIKSKIPRPAPLDVPVPPPKISMPAAKLPAFNVPAAGGPMSLEESLSTSTNPNDPKYKMGIGGRIMGTLANFLSGVAHQGPVVNTGRGALNSQYYRDEENRLRQLNDAKAQHELWREQQNDYWEQMRKTPQVQGPVKDSSSPDDEGKRLFNREP